MGVTADTKGLDLNLHVCSGKGICAYNQLTGRYGCECNDGYEAFGGYCTHSGCAGKVIHNGEIKYVECKVYDGTVGSCVQDTNAQTYSCSCGSTYKNANGLCVHKACMPGDVYCGGDALASCVRGSDNRYGCVCSEGYELSEVRNEYGNRAKCIPSKCMYKQFANSPAVECNGLGTCGTTGSLKDKGCQCNGDATEYTLRDATGELKKTCVLQSCISSMDKGVPVICGGFGRCEPTGCICDLGTKLINNACVGLDCLINTTSADGQLTESACGGETVGVCTKVASFGDRRDYACKCKDPSATGYKEVDGFCLPEQCVFNIPRLDEKDGVDTMCGGRHFGSCVINTADSTKSYCECKRQDHIVQITDKKCIKRDCLSNVVPGNTHKNVECSGHGKCATNNKIDYSCKCDQNYKTAKGVIGTYLCIPQVCVVSETDTAMVCNGRGTCLIDEQKCSCYKEYTGEKCSACASGYKEHTNHRCYLNNCPTDENCGTVDGASAGSCELVGSAFTCVCTNQNFVVDATSKQCRKLYCDWTDPYDRTEKTCYGMGTCSYSGATEQCSCNSGTTPIGTSVCVYAECMPSGNSNNPETICNGRGTCAESPVAGKGMCRCDSSRYRTDKTTGQCFPKECFGAHESILSEVCDGGGECVESAGSSRCNCRSPDFKNIDDQNGCVHTNCVSSDNKLCSGYGACESTNGNYRCLCANYYTLINTDCIPTRCLGSGGLCNGGGECSGEGASATCRCNSGWASHEALCYPAVCVSNGLICGGNGKCVFENGVTPTCVCNEGFSLTDDFVCGVPSNKSSAGTTAAIVVVVLLVLAAVAGFLVWRFVIRPRKGGALRERAPRKDASLTRSRSLKKQAASGASFHADAPLLSQLSNANSSIQL